MGYAVAAVLALLIGFAAGFTVFKRSIRWCPGCGWTFTPDHCRFANTATPAANAETRPRR